VLKREIYSKPFAYEASGAIGNIDFLLLWIPVVVGRRVGAVAPAAHNPAVVAVMIDD